MTRGRFISLEGGEGVGKSTQIRLLADALTQRGIEAVVTREPGGTAGAEAIRTLLMTGEVDRWSARGEALLFAAARADHAAKLIEPSLAAGKWVLCDRYVDSTRAYQGGGGGVSDDDVMTLHRIGAGGLLPDRTILLDLPPDKGLDRATSRDLGQVDRMGAKTGGYYDDVAARFRDIAEADPVRFRSVDATGDRENVHTRIIAALRDLL
jgi:dTMP kinase